MWSIIYEIIACKVGSCDQTLKWHAHIGLAVWKLSQSHPFLFQYHNFMPWSLLKFPAFGAEIVFKFLPNFSFAKAKSATVT